MAFQNLSTYSTVAQETSSWLETTTPSEIETYFHRLPEDKWSAMTGLSPELISLARIYRNQTFNILFKTNASTALREDKLLGLIDALTRYNQESVVKNYRKQYPGLILEPLVVDPRADCDRILTLWENTFLFIVTPKLMRYGATLKSLAKLNLSHEAVTELEKDIKPLVKEIVDFIIENNYLPTPASFPLQERIKAGLGKFSFLPPDYISRAAAGDIDMRLYQLLSGIEYDLGILAIVTQEDPPLTDEAILMEVLKQSLYTDAEIEAISHHNPPVIEDPVLTSTYEALLDMLTISNIEDGSVRLLLDDYMRRIGLERKSEFIRITEDFLGRSLDLQAVLDPIEIDSLILQIKKCPTTSARAELITTYQSSFSPERWPLAQKALQLIAYLI